MYPKKIILILIIFLTVGTNASAQDVSAWFNELFRNRMEYGGHIGTSHYIGELDQRIYGNQLFSGGISGKFHFNRIEDRDRTWGLRADLNYSRIEGSGWEPNAPIGTAPNHMLSFKNNIFEAALMGEFHFWNIRPYRGRKLMSPYIFAGIGGILHNPKAPDPDGGFISIIDSDVELLDGAVGNGFKNFKTVFSLPFGAGFKYNLSGPWSLAVEINYRYVFSDFLDGVGSGMYRAYDTLSPEPALPSNPSQDEIDAHSKWTNNKNRWELLTSPSTGGTPDYEDLINIPRGHKGNDFFMTTVFKATWTFYKYRDPSWK